MNWACVTTHERRTKYHFTVCHVRCFTITSVTSCPLSIFFAEWRVMSYRFVSLAENDISYRFVLLFHSSAPREHGSQHRLSSHVIFLFSFVEHHVL